MTIVVLTWLLLLMLSFTASYTYPPSETYELIHATNLAKQDCDSHCGDLIVPYPFGIGLNKKCSIDPGFDIHCNYSLKPPKAYFAESFRISIKNISDSTLRTSNDVATRCYSPDGTIRSSYSVHANYTNSQYTFSKLNKFTAMGCLDLAWLHSKTKSDHVSSGCMVFCDKEENVLKGQCSGNGCCQSSIPQDISHYRIRLTRMIYLNSTYNRTSSFNPCTHAFVGEKNAFKFNGAADLKDPKLRQKIIDDVPIVFDWAIGNTGCIEAEKMKVYACLSHSTCVDSKRETGGYRCKCKPGYEGNPYLSPGCQDINECKDKEKYPCDGDCINTPGSYNCTCPKGYIGNAKIKDGCERVPKIKNFWKTMFGVGIVIGIGVLIFTLWLFKEVPRWKDKKRREKFFERNGGSVLQPKKASGGGTVDHQTKIFPEIEIEKATEQFTKERIIGQGPNGIVYKGMLRDARIVAIKKLKWVDESQVETFINVVLALSKIIHENVVKLLGCCLETEVPMLVYEYINNGTLFHFIHDENYEIPQLLLRTMWETRLQIATEIAGALAYLHSVSSTRIYHRDIKSSNILLDDKFRAKLSDFGISKSVSEDQTHVSTSDPECDQSRDVYSFGIVLLELLTGKIFRKDSGENTDLEAFLLSMKDDQQVVENVDDRVKEAPKEQLIALAGLAKRCLNSNGKLRPNMKDVETELEGMSKSS